MFVIVAHDLWLLFSFQSLFYMILVAAFLLCFVFGYVYAFIYEHLVVKSLCVMCMNCLFINWASCRQEIWAEVSFIYFWSWNRLILNWFFLFISTDEIVLEFWSDEDAVMHVIFIIFLALGDIYRYLNWPKLL